MAIGNRPRALSVGTCASTLGLLGALESRRTCHPGAAPLCVSTIQPAGTEPGGTESKRMISAAAHAACPTSKTQIAHLNGITEVALPTVLPVARAGANMLQRKG